MEKELSTWNGERRVHYIEKEEYMKLRKESTLPRERRVHRMIISFKIGSKT